MNTFTHAKKPHQQTLSLNDIFLSDGNQQSLQQVLDEFRYRNILNQYNLPVANKLLLYGPSGCGKTATANAIAKHLNKKIISLQLGGFVSSKLGETAKNITATFREARLENAVLFIDEFDFIGKSRDYDQKDSGEMKRVVNTILQHLDDLDKNILFIGATNFVEVIDVALLRRFQVKLNLQKPNKEQLEGYYDYLLSKFPKEFINFKRKFGISYAEAQDYVHHRIKTQLIMAEKEKKQLLFSYGTLQQKNVQIETYGRSLQGTPDKLKGYEIKNLEIRDASVLEKSGKAIHPIADTSSNSQNFIQGTIYEITAEELFQTDLYEVDDYKRIEKTFDSGKKAWVYVKK